MAEEATIIESEVGVVDDYFGSDGVKDVLDPNAIALPEWMRSTHLRPVEVENLTAEENVVAAVEAFIGEKWRRLESMSTILRQFRRKDPSKSFWVNCIGTRYSKQRAVIQFITMILVGIILLTVVTSSTGVLEPDNILRLDNEIERKGFRVTNFTEMLIEIPDRTELDLDIEIESQDGLFNLYAMNETSFRRWRTGERVETIRAIDRVLTGSVDIRSVVIPNVEQEVYYLVVCPSEQQICSNRPFLETGRDNSSVWDVTVPAIEVSYTIEIDARCCLCDGAYEWLLVFLPWVCAVAHSFHLFRLILRRETLRSILETRRQRELNTPDDEVDYWQPNPWDRKCPKIHVFLPFLWSGLRRPTEPFFTWWRHENNFTWIFFPYRHERLSRWERGLIIYASFLVMFYASFYISVGSASISRRVDRIFGENETLKVYVIQLIPQPLVKAVFKEIFKLFYRLQRKRSRAQTETLWCNYYTANGGALFVLAIVHIPIILVLVNQSCAYVSEFFKFFLLAQILRLSILALFLDFVWYSILYMFGHRDLCIHCTDRFRSCVCFNDELLVLAVAKFGPRWNLIKRTDQILAEMAYEHQVAYEAQFQGYSADQIKERWNIIVDRARQHIEKVKRLNDLSQRWSRISRSSRIQRLVKDIPDTIVEERILGVDESLNHNVEDLEDDVVLTRRFLHALAQVNLCVEPENRRELNLTEHYEREMAFDSLEKKWYERQMRRVRRYFKTAFGI